MNRLGNLLLAGISLAVVLLPPRAVALAGLAEHYYTYHFNPLAHLVWANPGDLCEGDDNYCLDLIKTDRRNFEGIIGSLEAINVPTDPSSPYVIARRSSDETWFVYHLGDETFLIRDAALEQALSRWEDLGLTEPVFIESRNVDQHLEETAESLKSRWSWQIVLMAMSLLVPCFLLALVFGALANVFKRRHLKGGSRLQLILARVFMVPTALAGIVLVLSLGLLITLRIVGS
jgi:hypothetical protein